MKRWINKWKLLLADRIFLLTIVTVCISTIFVLTLFNIQIVEGKEYRERSEKKILRNEPLIATRGEIYYRKGEILATSKLSFDVILYRVKCTNQELNSSVSAVINILEKNNNKISSSFPINDTLTDFNFNDKAAEEKWKKEMKFAADASFEMVIDHYIKNYELQSYERKQAINIIQVRYEASLMGYSLFKYATIAKDISNQSLAQIEEMKNSLFGIKTISVPKRYYEQDFLTAHTVGYVSKIDPNEYVKLKDSGYKQNDVIGKIGIEQTFEKYLKGIDGNKKAEVDFMGLSSSETVAVRPVSGNNITLTLDYRLQKVAYDSLAKTIQDIQTGNGYMKHEDAKSGAVIVVDVNSGEILASVSYPSYHTNDFSGGIDYKKWRELNDSPLKPMYNRAISGTYSPGSTYKMLVGVAGMEKGNITPTEKIQDPGIYPYGHKPKCWIYEKYGRTHGYIDVSEAIKVSCNCFFYETGKRLGISDIIYYSKVFGLGEKTGVEVVGESQGTIGGEGVKEWYLGDTLSASIGQTNNSYTMLQLANYISAIANGGTLPKLTYIKSIEKNNAQQVSRTEIEENANSFTGTNIKERKLDISKQSLDAVKKGMLMVTQPGGTSYQTFKDLGIKVAGKTGTAEVTSGSSNGIFVGFAPYDNPEIAVVAVIEHGGEGTYVANVVRPIMDEYFQITKQDMLNFNNHNVLDSKITF